jgi:hypothetical protein
MQAGPAIFPRRNDHGHRRPLTSATLCGGYASSRAAVASGRIVRAPSDALLPRKPLQLAPAETAGTN